MASFSPSLFRQQFPILAQAINGKPLVYFDNAASTQKPIAVIDCYQRYYQTSNANVHRASHALSSRATAAYEESRQRLKVFINAKYDKELIWTKGSTESINLVAQSWGRKNLQPNDEIVLSYSEHHANIVPWQIVAEQTGAKIKVLQLTSEGRIDTTRLEETIGDKTRIVCCAHISNVLGRINPIVDVINVAKQYRALTLIDGAQAIAHLPVDVQALGCDFYVFSAHKMYGPTGVGVLYGKREVLEGMPPYQAGGEMIKSVSFEQSTFNDLPHKFEAGTPNIAGIVAFGAMLDFIKTQQLEKLAQYEKSLAQYCFEQLSQVPGLSFVVDGQPDIPVFSFTMTGQHNHDVAAELDSHGIAVRAGHHCAMPLMQYLNLEGCIRLSLAAYNTIEEIDQAVLALKKISGLNSDNNTTVMGDVVLNGNLEAAKDLAFEQIKASDIANELTIEDVLALFAKAKSWDSKHREIMLLGKKKSTLAAERKNEQSLISGCESKAWLSYQKQASGTYLFSGDSDAKVIRGLLTIVLAAVNNKNREQISVFNMQAYFDEIGLLQHLSPSRGNGLRAIVDKIYQIVA
ncbi:SufS family cysteine desulfurase [Cognaticolwellia mytili]|uniref:SufS family cysteine desulfurase n=1 Tax=Cognaticolwellia mytili TaxID=1888913 RepID=UPI000A16FF56|nr:SufS family cysteine desulfurase [Cognaticolwellia mytili]